MRRSMKETSSWVLGNGERGISFYEKLVSTADGQAEYVDLDCFSRRNLQAREENSFPHSVYLVPEETAYGSLPDLFAAFSQWPSYDLRLARSSAGEFPYFGGTVRKENGLEFICFRFGRMSLAGRVSKRIFDLLSCSLGLLLLSPLLFLSGVLVKCGSAGPVFYSQERIGKGGKAFRIYKFRSMYQGAEKDAGPCLSSKGDSRITSWGRVMRRYRIDELPQLWNVLKGDMSLVGYRPERDFFIVRIQEVSPYYPLLYSVRPGVSSLGITTCGYAENVPQMLVRLEKDMEYLAKVSLRADADVLFRTVKVVLYGVGK